jgi:dTDP-4-dehydrorhamnose 3,5-epimerase|tara:strand:- start:1059 stop:1583 length:525 start_codon:yes stop_codon:yes gene_type:complete
MKIIKTKFKDLLVFKSKNYKDKRGSLRELSLEKNIKKKLIFSLVSKSRKNVLRGLHMQTKQMQGKYLSVLKGKILDVVVDCRKMSKTFGKHFKIILSEKNATSIYIPPGFAHGFLTLDKENIVLYSCTNYRNKESEVSIAWNDKYLKIKWPIKKPILSKKDSNCKSFQELNLKK